MNQLIKRLDKIEASGPKATCFVWRERGEAEQAAIARHLSGHPEDQGKEMIVIGWKG